jgi:hypothetical protein
MASVPLPVPEFTVEFQPTTEKPTTEFEFATAFRIPAVGVVVPIPTLPVVSAIKSAWGAL